MMKEPINCAEHIASACSALNLSLQTVKALFFGKEIYEIYYSCKDEKYFQLEIQLNIVTLTCLFDKNNICEGAFLLFDDLEYIVSYINYCNEVCLYDVILKGWILNSCLIQINTGNKECYLIILPITQG